MKIIIVEGLDNTGKTTVIEEISDICTQQGLRVNVQHFTKPASNMTNIEKANYQNIEYKNYIKKLAQYSAKDVFDVVIIDRCWYSEYVYGQIYRGRTSDELEQCVCQLEHLLLSEFEQDDLSLILLTVNNLQFCVRHEDGLSLSGADMIKLDIEHCLFDEIVKKTLLLHSGSIIVNDNLEFRPKQTILNEICDIIKLEK